MIKSISVYLKNKYKNFSYSSILLFLTPDNSPVNSPVTSPALPTRTPPNTPVTSPSTTTTTPASTPGGTSGNKSGNKDEICKGEEINTENKSLDNKTSDSDSVKVEDTGNDKELPVEGTNLKQIGESDRINGANTSGNIRGDGGSGSSDLSSPMDQFEIHPFLGNLFGLNHTPLGLVTNILVYIGLAVSFILLFYIYGSFKDNIKING
jgi:hypothetical protein